MWCQFLLASALVVSLAVALPIEEDPADLLTEESQSFGYGYGTKVADKYGVSTVYVHGFGTTNDPQPPTPVYIPPAKAKGDHPPLPASPKGVSELPLSHTKYYGNHIINPYSSGYHYGNIDAYGHARHGYKFAHGGGQYYSGHSLPYYPFHYSGKAYAPSIYEGSGFGYGYGYGNL